MKSCKSLRNKQNEQELTESLICVGHCTEMGKELRKVLFLTLGKNTVEDGSEHNRPQPFCLHKQAQWKSETLTNCLLFILDEVFPKVLFKNSVLCVFETGVSLHTPNCPGIFSADQAGLELTEILLPLLPECQV